MKTSPSTNVTDYPQVTRYVEGETLFLESNAKVSWLGRVPYLRGLAIMESLVREKIDGSQTDWFLYLEHEPVITYGRATPPSHLPHSVGCIPCIEVTRGGLATYHGPGQLVGYVICDLRRRVHGAKPDLHEFLRALEEGIASYLTEVWNLSAGSLPGKTGVWIANGTSPRKIVSIGIGVKRWISYHGFALNVSTDMQIFSQFVPCGLEGVTMTSIAAELQSNSNMTQPLDLKTVATSLHRYVITALRHHGWCREEIA